MSNRLHEERVDIYQLPWVKKRELGENQITIGDLHGNAIKLMFTLVSEGIVTNMTSEDYQALVRIYLSPIKFVIPSLLSNFNRILSSLEFDTDVMLRLIGDELADRGMNDYFTLKILEKLKEKKVPVEIIVSNHSVEFLLACELETVLSYQPQVIPATSMKNLQLLLQKGIVQDAEILEIVTESYQPTLKLISYSLSQSKSEITIYSHGKASLATIEGLALQLQVPYEDANVDALASTIDKINEAFNTYVQRKKVYELYMQTTAFWDTLWERKSPDDTARPATQHGYHLFFCHGHHSAQTTCQHVFGLDQDLGKMEVKQGRILDYNEGKHPVLHSKHHSIESKCISDVDSKDIDQALISLKEQSHALGRRSFLDAQHHSHAMFNTIQIQRNRLVQGSIDTDVFKGRCYNAIELAKPTLKEHRGFKGGFFKSAPTASALILERLKQAIQAFASLVDDRKRAEASSPVINLPSP